MGVSTLCGGHCLLDSFEDKLYAVSCVISWIYSLMEC